MVCGLPFDYEIGDNAQCAACLRRPPLYDRARAVMRYDEGARRLIVGLKHRDRTEGARAFASWMARSGAELIRQSDVIAPVPLHWTRLIRRRYNQAALLSQALTKLSGKPLIADLLVRTRRTPSQGGLDAAERRANVRAAMAVRRRREAAVAGKQILLVDDVLTTGATADSCAQALRKAGARAVLVLVLARVVRPERHAI